MQPLISLFATSPLISWFGTCCYDSLFIFYWNSLTSMCQFLRWTIRSATSSDSTLLLQFNFTRCLSTPRLCPFQSVISPVLSVITSAVPGGYPWYSIANDLLLLLQYRLHIYYKTLLILAHIGLQSSRQCESKIQRGLSFWSTDIYARPTNLYKTF